MPPPASPLSLLRSLPTDTARALWKAALWERRSSAAAAASTTADAAFEGRFDVVVVGGGVNGSSTAFELAGRGLRVALLEQFDFLHRRGSSHGESRIIRRTYPQRHYTAGMGQAYELWDAAQREYGSSVFTRTGGLDFAVSGNAALQQLVASSAEHGVAHAQLSPAEVAARFPAFRLPPDYTAVWQADAGVLNATKAVAMFQSLAARRGAVLRDRTPALAVTHVADGVRVDTPRGALHADKVVLACGAWTSKVLSGLGVDVAATLKAVPVAVSYWRCKDAAAAELLAAARCPVAIGYTGAGLGHASEAECYLTPVLELPGLVKVSLHLPEVSALVHAALCVVRHRAIACRLTRRAARSTCGALRSRTRTCG